MKRFSLLLIVVLLGCGSGREPESVPIDSESQAAPAETPAVSEMATDENETQPATDDSTEESDRG